MYTRSKNLSSQPETCLVIWLSILGLLVSGCGPGQLLGPTLTPTFTITPTPTVVPTSTPKPPITPTPSAQEEEAWRNVPCMDVQSLREFIDTYPIGTYVNDAQLALSLFEKIEAIKVGKFEPVFVIPFGQLGARWQSWKKSMPNKGAVGIFRTERILVGRLV